MTRVTGEFIGRSARRRWRFLVSAMCVSCLAASAAWAQSGPAGTPAEATPVATQTQSAQIEEVIVTGTRIKSRDALSAAPIVVVGAADIAKTKAVTVEQILAKIPAIDFANGNSANDNNGGLGSSEVGLRNLGPERTLVLVNGYRFPFTDTQSSTDAVDLNNIPTGMIDHIDVLLDGASSIYGADAIGGVINIITKQHAEGLTISTSGGFTGSGSDGVTYSTEGTLGLNLDRGNVLLDVSHDSRDPIPASDRSWATNLHTEADINGPGNVATGLSSRVPGAKAYIGDSVYFFPSGVASGLPAGSAGQMLGATLVHGINPINDYYVGGGLPPGDITIPNAGGTYIAYLPTEYLQGGLDRNQLNMTASYNITPDITAHLEGFYTNRQSKEELNPEPLGVDLPTQKFPNGLISPAFLPYAETLADGTVLPAGSLNPYNPTNQPNAAALYGAANVNTDVPFDTRRLENGPRVYTDDINTYRLRVGLDGTVFDNYDWQVGYYYGKSSATYRVAGEADFARLYQLSGQLPCGADAANGCSLADLFGYNTLSKSQANYFIYDNTDTSEYTQNVAYGSVSGPVYELPAGTLKTVVGFEYRTENLFDNPDSITAAGDGATPATPTRGGYNVGSGYVEANIPVLKDIFLAKSLTLDFSGRYDYFSTFGHALTWTGKINWAVDDNFRFRGSHSTGFRAPQVRELFGGAISTTTSGTDPCATGGQFAATPQCIAVNHGNPDSIIQTTGQLSAIEGGNSNLKPEQSQQWSFGGVFTPVAVPGLDFSVDYYNILIRGEINSYNASSLLNLCYGGVPYIISYQAACTGPNALVTRQASGTLGLIYILNANTSNEQEHGLDFAADYSFKTAKLGLHDGGSVTINGTANYVINDNLVDDLTHTTVAQAGTFGFDPLGIAGEPRWKASLSATYAQPDWSFTWQERYYGGVKNFSRANDCEGGAAPVCPTVGAGDFEGNEAAGVFYSDLNFLYKYNIATFIFGIDNVFDKDPPYIPAQGDVYLPNAGYDNVGRFIYTKVSVTF